MKIKIYGSKGTIPLFSKECQRSGGNTSCVRIDTKDGTIVLDCGTGLVGLGADLAQEAENGTPVKLDILLSHLHLDHILGLCAFKPLWDTKNDIRIYTKKRGQGSLASQVFGVFKPPYWPVDLGEMFAGELVEIKEDAPFYVNEGTRVTAFASAHSDGTTAFRIEAEKTVVYLLDYEIDKEDCGEMKRLSDFCRKSDLIIFDSSYLPEDMKAKRGWGHSTYEAGIALAEMSKCKKMVFSHFSYEYTDEEIDGINAYICGLGDKYAIACDGMDLIL